MSLTLIEGPAGSGKSQIVAEMLAAGELDIQADLTGMWVSLRGVERDPATGRYPIRQDTDPAVATGMAAYMRAAAVRQGLRQGLRVGVTSGTPESAPKWAEVAREADTAFNVVTVDPGRTVVTARLEVDGELSDQCERAIRRWYG